MRENGHLHARVPQHRRLFRIRSQFIGDQLLVFDPNVQTVGLDELLQRVSHVVLVAFRTRRGLRIKAFALLVRIFERRHQSVFGHLRGFLVSRFLKRFHVHARTGGRSGRTDGRGVWRGGGGGGGAGGRGRGRE